MSDRNLFPAGMKYQGSTESISYAFTMTNWGTVAASPAPSTTLTDITLNQTCTTAKLSGATILANNIITTPKVISLTAGNQYRLKIAMTISGNSLTGYMDILAED